MESIAELRKICQTAFKREPENVYGHFIRIFSIYVTRLLIPTSITANQVSVIMIVVGSTATLFFLSPSRWFFLTGALLMQFWYTLDGVDGEVARYRHYQKSGSQLMDKRDGSLTGMYLDMINHYIINFLLPVALGLGLFYQRGETRWLFIGIAASLAQVLMLSMHDARCRTQLTHLKRFSHIEVMKESAAETESPKKRSPARWVFIALHNTLTYPAVMNLTGLAALFNIFFPSLEWRVPLLGYLCLGSIVVSGTLIGRFVRRQLTEEEFHKTFRVSNTAGQSLQGLESKKNPKSY